MTDTADRIILAAHREVIDRRQKYGEPAAMYAEIARRWSIELGTDVTAHDVVRCLLQMKMARMKANPHHRDTTVDVAGYAGIGWECRES